MEIALLVVIGMMLAIVILKMAMLKTEAGTIGTLVLGVAVIGMEAEVQAVTREEVIEIGQVLTTAQAGEDGRLPTSAIKVKMYVRMSVVVCSQLQIILQTCKLAMNCDSLYATLWPFGIDNSLQIFSNVPLIHQPPIFDF